ncbi:TetR/AcrR family transcriptional regulator [Actinoplanes sp. HUAS TT8]|uniref:TetR/AcrR family transcriptional regulator n=1 Tax=Actinoplanes sp. HUAS TT8 TaxID=3447453 RepID=UPI003F52328C
METTRDRIIRAASRLLIESGRDAVTIRSVSAAAGVQTPVIYRLFDDKTALLEAVAGFGMREYLADKDALGETADPVADLARAWDLHVRFGLARPDFYLIAFSPAPADHQPDSTVRQEAVTGLRRMVERIAAAGRLRTSVERATHLVHAGGVGVVVSQLALPPHERDAGVSATAWNAVRREIVLHDHPPTATEASDLVKSHAGALRQALAGAGALSRAETELLTEWLIRISDHHA